MIGVSVVTGVRVYHMRVPDADETRPMLACLTPTELTRANAIRSETRRREHIASRVLAKHMVLAGAASDGGFMALAVDQLGELRAEEYHEIEILRADGAPRVFRCGVALDDLHLSIAHSTGTTAVGVSTDSPIGIDLATIEEHAPSFHRVHYSPREREWIGRGARAASNTLFTLLWTLKECVIKAGGAPDATLWGYDEVEVLVDACPRAVAESLDTGTPVTMAIGLSCDRVGSASITRFTDTILSSVVGIQEA